MLFRLETDNCASLNLFEPYRKACFLLVVRQEPERVGNILSFLLPLTFSCSIGCWSSLREDASPLLLIKCEIVLNQRIFEPVRGHQRVEYLSISTCVWDTPHPIPVTRVSNGKDGWADQPPFYSFSLQNIIWILNGQQWHWKYICFAHFESRCRICIVVFLSNITTELLFPLQQIP